MWDLFQIYIQLEAFSPSNSNRVCVTDFFWGDSTYLHIYYPRKEAQDRQKQSLHQCPIWRTNECFIGVTNRSLREWFLTRRSRDDSKAAKLPGSPFQHGQHFLPSATLKLSTQFAGSFTALAPLSSCIGLVSCTSAEVESLISCHQGPSRHFQASSPYVGCCSLSVYQLSDALQPLFPY